MDFVWPRFYNARACNIVSSGFAPSLQAWRTQLDGLKGTTSPFPKLYIGAVDFDTGANYNGFLQPHNFTNVVIAASCKARSRFGGVMLWDATNGLKTIEDGKNFLESTKTALTGNVMCSGQASGDGRSNRVCHAMIMSVVTSLYNCKSWPLSRGA